MVLIFSEKRDVSTVKVMEWLIFHFKKSVIRLNTDDNDDYRLLKYDNKLKNLSLLVNNKIVDTKDIKSVWFRRGNIRLNFDKNENIAKSQYFSQVNNCLQFENARVSEYANLVFSKKHKIGDFYNQDVNKLYILDVAEGCDLLVPKTLVTSSKECLINFINIHGEVITKPIGVAPNINTENSFFLCYTKIVDSNILEQLPDLFYPSLFQEKIEKKYEVRVFYLCGEFYSMAIFSQLDSQTKVDFRNYNFIKPNRTIPYKLPTRIEKNITRFMKKINLDNGSLDIIVDKKNNYVFLEVNPVGQFDMVSVPCNYPIEKKIAEILIKESNERQTTL